MEHIKSDLIQLQYKKVDKDKIKVTWLHAPAWYAVTENYKTKISAIAKSNNLATLQLNVQTKVGLIRVNILQVGFSYILLRNDDTSFRGYEDYDRYVVSLRDEHRFNPIWKSIVDFQYVIGDFDPTDPEVADAVVGELAPGRNLRRRMISCQMILRNSTCCSQQKIIQLFIIHCF